MIPSARWSNRATAIGPASKVRSTAEPQHGVRRLVISRFSDCRGAGIDLPFHTSCVARRYGNIPQSEQNDQRKIPQKNGHGDFSQSDGVPSPSLCDFAGRQSCCCVPKHCSQRPSDMRPNAQAYRPGRCFLFMGQGLSGSASPRWRACCRGLSGRRVEIAVVCSSSGEYRDGRAVGKLLVPKPHPDRLTAMGASDAF